MWNVNHTLVRHLIMSHLVGTQERKKENMVLNVHHIKVIFIYLDVCGYIENTHRSKIM